MLEIDDLVGVKSEALISALQVQMVDAIDRKKEGKNVDSENCNHDGSINNYQSNM